MAPVHQFFHLEPLVQIDHRYIAQLVVEMTTTGRIVSKIICAQNVGQGHMLHKCPVHLPIQVKLVIFAYTVVAKNILQVTVPVRPNDNREEPRSTPRDLHNLGPHFGNNTENLGVS